MGGMGGSGMLGISEPATADGLVPERLESFVKARWMFSLCMVCYMWRRVFKPILFSASRNTPNTQYRTYVRIHVLTLRGRRRSTVRKNSAAQPPRPHVVGLAFSGRFAHTCWLVATFGAFVDSRHLYTFGAFGGDVSGSF